MQNISLLLDKFKNLTNHSLIVREVAEEILEKELSIKVNKDQLQFKGGVLSVKISGPAKVEIFLAKEMLVQKINGRLGRIAVNKII